jgi:ribosomal protein S18 acetylase RimI-like enzyme
MKYLIRAFVENDIEAIVELSLAAWEPVFISFEEILGPRIYPIVYPDWRTSQKEGVEKICLDQENYQVMVAESNGLVVGFLAYEIHKQNNSGEVILLAVHPDHQNLGIGTDLNRQALKEMKAAGMRLAVVGTGGDPSHAPARRSYEKAGYIPLALVRYYKDL